MRSGRGRRARAPAPLAGRRHRALPRRATTGWRAGPPLLSPYLHFGCVSAREVEQRARAKGGKGAAAFVRQLAWRDFYAHVLLHHPGNARRAYKPQFDALTWADDGDAFDGLVRRAAPGFRSSTPACASCSTRAGCTTARG